MTEPRLTSSDIERAIRNIPDFPKPGIQFKDITPVLADARLFAGSIELLTQSFRPGLVDAVVGIDARGFIFAAAAVHVDALKPGARVLLIDDLLATGGTAAAAAALVQKLGAKILEISFLIELSFLSGREKLKSYPVRSLVVF